MTTDTIATTATNRHDHRTTSPSSYFVGKKGRWLSLLLLLVVVVAIAFVVVVPITTTIFMMMMVTTGVQAFRVGTTSKGPFVTTTTTKRRMTTLFRDGPPRAAREYLITKAADHHHHHNTNNNNYSRSNLYYFRQNNKMNTYHRHGYVDSRLWSSTGGGEDDSTNNDDALPQSQQQQDPVNNNTDKLPCSSSDNDNHQDVTGDSSLNLRFQDLEREERIFRNLFEDTTFRRYRHRYHNPKVKNDFVGSTNQSDPEGVRLTRQYWEQRKFQANQQLALCRYWMRRLERQHIPMLERITQHWKDAAQPLTYRRRNNSVLPHSNVPSWLTAPHESLVPPFLAEERQPAFLGIERVESICNEIYNDFLQEPNSEDDNSSATVGEDLLVRPPMALTRCIGGGKTRTLCQIAQTLQAIDPSIRTLYLTFKDAYYITSAESRERNEQQTPLQMLLTRMVFAGIKERDYTKSVDQYKMFHERLEEEGISITHDFVTDWLSSAANDNDQGGRPGRCVLLIDDMDLVPGLDDGYVIPNDPPTARIEEFLLFLKSQFLSKKGHYMVFTARHEKTIQRLRYVMHRSEPCVVREMPIVTSLEEAQKAFDWPELTRPQIIRYGLVPGLVYQARNHDDTPYSILTNTVVAEWINDGITEVKVENLMYGILNGFVNTWIPDPFYQLMDTRYGADRRYQDYSGAIVLWIPYHLEHVLDRISTCFSIHPIVRRQASTMSKLLHRVISTRQGATVGNQWNDLFVFSLLVNIMCGTSYVRVQLKIEWIHVDVVTYRELICPEKVDLDQLLEQISMSRTEGDVTLDLYYFAHDAKCHCYDMIVACSTNAEFHIYGFDFRNHTVSCGATATVAQPHPRVTKSILVRFENNRDSENMAATPEGWTVFSEKELKEFFGFSLWRCASFVTSASDDDVGKA